MVTFEDAHYSVPAHLCGAQVFVRAHALIQATAPSQAYRTTPWRTDEGRFARGLSFRPDWRPGGTNYVT
ncbi:hypothetical protein [Sinomonas mesophila]|uniref:hypothetical protein n=1 Tax=Sinomonas mesophila TaxID=1531955 RepID=UPI001115871D|nr:hypothetical protein [Sinomonas mesophila]